LRLNRCEWFFAFHFLFITEFIAFLVHCLQFAVAYLLKRISEDLMGISVISRVISVKFGDFGNSRYPYRI
jgi:hypothetical protein